MKEKKKEKKRALVNWFVLCGHTLKPSVLLHQVVLLTSSLDPVAQSLADKLKERTGCRVVQVGEEPQEDVAKIVEQRKLQWKDVAYMGTPLSVYKTMTNCIKIQIARTRY